MLQIEELPAGRRLRVLRVAANLTLFQLGTKASVSPARISDYERGVGQLSSDAIDRLCSVLEEATRPEVLSAAS